MKSYRLWVTKTDTGRYVAYSIGLEKPEIGDIVLNLLGHDVYDVIFCQVDKGCNIPGRRYKLYLRPIVSARKLIDIGM